MHAIRPIVIGAGLLAAGMSALAASVSVTFVQPEKFTDAAPSRPFATERDRAEVQRELEQHLQRLGARSLAANESLKIEVLDIDLAGHFEPFRLRNGADVRIVRDITWPRITLRYSLARDDRVVASAEEHISDMNYLMSPSRYSSADRLRYEKAMLDDWFRKRIARR